MRKRKFSPFSLGLAAVLLLVLFSGCSASSEGFDRDGAPILSSPDYVRTPPPVKLAEFVGTTQETREADGNSAAIDMTNVAQGYVAVQSVAGVDSMVEVKKTDGSSSDMDNYFFPSNGETVYLPITRGNGQYSFTLRHKGEEMEDGSGYYYYEFLAAQASVTLESEFAPFQVPNIFVNYNEDSKLVDFSYNLAQHASTDLEVAQQIYYWIANNVTYDTFKAEQVKSGMAYVPNPDETLSTKKGICYDYASLAAAMLRANGIPCQLIKGDVKAGDSYVYHAWNLFWTDETGWISVKLPSAPNDWNRIDLTFAAGRGSSLSQFIGDGENYNSLATF